MDALEWEGNSTIYLAPLDGSGQVRAYGAAPFFGFHHVNAWEEADGTIVFDILADANLSAFGADPFSPLTLANPICKQTRSIDHT